MPQRLTGMLLEFIFNHLDRATFGERLRWVHRASGVFQLYWKHGNRMSDSQEEDYAVFMAWHKHKSRPNSCTYLQAKQRFRVAINKMGVTLLKRWRKRSPMNNFQFRKFPGEALGWFLKRSRLGQNGPRTRSAVALLNKENDADRDAELTPSQLPKSKLTRKRLPRTSPMSSVSSDPPSTDDNTSPVPLAKRELSASDAVLMNECPITLEDELALRDGRAASVQVTESKVDLDYLSPAPEANFVDLESSAQDSASGRDGSVAFGNAERASDSSVMTPSGSGPTVRSSEVGERHELLESMARRSAAASEQIGTFVMFKPQEESLPQGQCVELTPLSLQDVCDILLRHDIIPTFGLVESETPPSDWCLENFGFVLNSLESFTESDTVGSDHVSEDLQAFGVHANQALSGTGAEGRSQENQLFTLQSPEPVEMKPFSF